MIPADEVKAAIRAQHREGHGPPEYVRVPLNALEELLADHDQRGRAHALRSAERDEARAIAAQAVGERQAAEHNAREARRTEALAWLKTVGAGEEYFGLADKLTEHGRRGAFDSGTLAATRAMTERLLADALAHVATLESQVAELNRELAEAVAKTKAPF